MDPYKIIETYLGFDVGVKRTGIAIANNITMHACSIDTIVNHKNGDINWNKINKIVSDFTICKFIIGMPFDKDSNKQKITLTVKSFAKKLNLHYHIDVEFIDEYLSSNMAKKQLKYNHYHPNAKRGDVDKLAAQLILQTWLNERQSNKQRNPT